jgi:hypothetical protein
MAAPYEIISARLNEIGLQHPRVVKLASEWLAAQKNLPEGRRALCINLDCGEAFSGSLSWYFVACLPEGRSGPAMAGCICPKCAVPKDQQNLLFSWVRQVLPDVEVEERHCGQCSACCKAFEIGEPLRKPANTWCQHCRPGKGGCMIYQSRPEGCKEFKCSWLSGSLGDEWYPAKSKIVARTYIHSTLGDPIMEFWVDPGYPNRWREQPYYAKIKHLSLVGLSLPKDTGYMTQVVVGPIIFMIYPSGEISRRVTITAEEQKQIAVEALRIIEDSMNHVHRFCTLSHLKFSDAFVMTYER